MARIGLWFIKLAQWIVRGAIFLVPWIIRIALATFWVISTAAAAWWVGVPKTAANIADYWRTQVYAAGVPTEYEQTVYYVGYTVAMIVIIACWVLAAYITVILIGLIF